MAAGSISESEFANLANIFFTMSVRNNDTWELKTSPSDTSQHYLCKRCYVDVAMETKETVSSLNPQLMTDQLTGMMNQDNIEVCFTDKLSEDNIQVIFSDCSIQDMDAACLPQDEKEAKGENSSPCLFEYHIVYSASYGVPVLYFNAYNQGGGLLSLEQVWNSVPPHYQQRLQEERWTFLTQQEHPILGRPFFQLHPCHTADLMKQLDSQECDKNYLVSWLSAVGPVVGLKLPLSYAQT